MVLKNFFRVHHSLWWDHRSLRLSLIYKAIIGLLYRALIVFDEQTWPDTWRLVVKRRTELTSIERFVSVNIWLTWTQVSRKNKKNNNQLFLFKIQQTFYWKKRNNKWIIMRFHCTGILLYSWSSKVCLKTNDAITKKLRDFKWHQVYPGTKSLIGPLLLLWFHAYTYFGTIFIPSLECLLFGAHW